jgi:hypothetical protein
MYKVSIMFLYTYIYVYLLFTQLSIFSIHINKTLKYDKISKSNSTIKRIININDYIQDSCYNFYNYPIYYCYYCYGY